MTNDNTILAVDHVIEYLATDKAWHTLNEIAQNTALPTQEITEITDFLATIQFISLNTHGKKAKIKKSLDKFLKQIKEVENISPR
jgi:DNA-binding IclR family transcriptional regulator